ncbi:MAG TPA: TIGR00366 family protein [Candidatus Tyrphobacter sp.]
MNRVAGFFVRVFEHAIPDPYVFAVGLTLIAAVLAFIFAPHHAPSEILGAWYGGIFSILAFALQMILILVTGYALASSVPVRRLLSRVASIARTPRAAVVLAFLVSAVACWLNWGFGLVVAGLLAREIAGRVRIDFGWLVAAAYAGFIVWASGLSSSIALAQATPGSSLNIVQQLTGHVLSLRETIFTPFNLVPVVVLVVVLPFVFLAMEPKDAVPGGPSTSTSSQSDEIYARDDTREAARGTLASALERAWILNLVLVAAGGWYLVTTWSKSGFALDINSVIFIFLMLGLLLHWRPIAYVHAIDRAARVSGPLIIQYPLYGGIMGIITATGLAGVIASWFLAFSSAATLPFFSYLASVIISLFVPSGGGHWAVQGPFAVPAAAHLHASQAATAMGVAMGEQVANMVQPFWCLPVLAIAGIGLRRVMPFTVAAFFIGLVVYGASLLLLAPRP